MTFEIKMFFVINFCQSNSSNSLLIQKVIDLLFFVDLLLPNLELEIAKKEHCKTLKCK